MSATLFKNPVSPISYTLFFISLILSISIKAQSSIDDSFSNYSFQCSDNSSCSDMGSFTATYYYTAPHDGQLAISGYASPGIINCCNTSYQMVCSGSFRKISAPANVHMFTDQLSTGYLDCIKAGEMVEINFSGNFGDYGYAASVTPNPTPPDVEPNDWFVDAISMTHGSTYTGHLKYGIYTSDSRDNYSFTAPTEGTLSLTVSTDVQLNVSTYRNDSLFLGSETINTNPYTFNTACFAAGDQLFFRFATAQNCTGYTFDVDFMPPQFGVDVEPNNTISTAITTNDIYGAIGHGVSDPLQPDAQDFYALPYLKKDEELDFDVQLIGGPVTFRVRSNSFSGFLQTLGTINNTVANFSFQAPFNDQFFLELLTSTGNCGIYNVTVSGCVKELILTGTEINVVALESDSIITSTQHIQSTAMVDYNARDFINLDALFEVNTGAVFHAFIEGCGN